MNGNKSSGTDGIHPRVLKEFKYKIAELLTVLKMESAPGKWKMASSEQSRELQTSKCEFC